MLLVDILLEWVFECTGTLFSFNHLMNEGHTKSTPHTPQEILGTWHTKRTPYIPQEVGHGRPSLSLITGVIAKFIFDIAR